ncbi:MAG: ABC transporter permease [Lachnospiraceae bacterium]|nr:ABC transporter permease [Lachnospiraceae bacterium]
MGRLFRRFLGLEAKRALKIVPQYYLGTLLLVTLFAAVTLCGQKALGGDELQGSVNIALVMNDDYIENFGLDVLQSAASAATVFRFSEATEEDGMAGLREGRYDGVMIFPENFVDSVFSDNYAGAAKLYSPKMLNSLNQGLMEGIVEVGCNLIKVSASQVQAGVAVAREHGADDTDAWRIQDDLENLLADRVINREESFVAEDASGTYGQTLLQYYFCAGIVMLLMLGGVACGTLLKSDAKSLEDQLAMRGIGSPLLALARYLSVLMLFFAFYVSLFLILYVVWLGWPDTLERYLGIMKVGELWFWFCAGIPVLLLAAALVLFVYTFAANQIGGILLLFLITAIMGYASGCIVPSAYLPKAVRGPGRYLPTATMLRVSVDGLKQLSNVRGTLVLLAETAVAFGATVALMAWNRWREQR